MTPRRHLALCTLAALIAGAALVLALAARAYPGRGPVLVAFVVSQLALVALAFSPPRLYTFTFLATFLFLGFTPKLLAHLLFGTALLEPVGGFTGTPEQWDRALALGLAGSGGLALARVAHLALARRIPSGVATLTAPPWVERRRRLLLTAAAGCACALYAANYLGAVLQMGVEPRVVLPLHLNVVVAFLVSTGIPMLLAVVLTLCIARWPERSFRSYLVPTVDGILAGASTLSRVFYLLRTLPYLVAALDPRERVPLPMRRRQRAALLLALGLGFALSVASVMALRLVTFPSSGPAVHTGKQTVTAPGQAPRQYRIKTRRPDGRPRPPSASSSGGPSAGQTSAPAPRATPGAAIPLKRRVHWAVREVRLMVVGRWTGLEGAMAVAAADTGPELLARAIVESPGLQNRSLYQRLAKASYGARPGVAFMTIPGVVAVLGYSGSLAVVLLGMAWIAVATLGIEILARRLVPSPFFLATLGSLLAYHVAQVNFPYLAAVYLAEVLAAVLLLHLALRLARLLASGPSGTPPAAAPTSGPG